jgi:hypothetical protein
MVDDVKRSDLELLSELYGVVGHLVHAGNSWLVMNLKIENVVPAST